jgi:hypothetical protein
MDHHRFDLLTRSLGAGSRRTLLRFSLAALASSLWIGARAPVALAACKPPGSRCKQSAQCCSGECRKKGRKRRKKCAPLPANAHGCTTDDASCPNGQDGTPCPNLDNGRCRITVKGRPVCAVRATLECESCQANADCLDALGVGAICVRCESCASGTTCICPFFVT